MSKKVSKTAIGAFVLGAVVLLVAGVLVLGAGKFFTREHVFVTYFEGSVKGLNVGSPVMFRGVKVGAVNDITIMADPATGRVTIPVIFSLQPARFKGTRAEFQREPKSIEKAVEAGLRAQLETQSFVTGQLMVSLDFFPDKPARFVGLVKEYPEVPSIPTPLEELQKTVENLPIKEMVETLNHTLAGVDRLVNDIDAKRTMQSLDAALEETRALMQNLNGRVGTLAESMERAARSADSALVETKKTMVTVSEDIRQTLSEVQTTLDSARSALKNSERTLQTYGEDSPMAGQMYRTMRNLSEVTRSLRQVTDYLERHPEALLRGKAAE
ncbi:MlaD family protein [Desulfuromonas sp. TF]|uniref:MlaD family protein n=1 Tax=Desulfuromonas sp. TF TaxID=1232410 RepID=UPI0004020ACF|nr:MlaD family protein [Desulfuromonas sp. TF]